MILEIREAVKYFDGFCALHNVSMSIAEGRIHAIIGPNGAGKTTLFNLISGMHDLTSGGIWFKEQRLNELKPHLRAKLGIGRTFQIVRLFDSLTVLENVMLGRHCKTRAGLFRTFFNFSLKELEEENARLKRMYANLAMDNEILRDQFTKKDWALPPKGN